MHEDIANQFDIWYADLNGTISSARYCSIPYKKQKCDQSYLEVKLG